MPVAIRVAYAGNHTPTGVTICGGTQAAPHMLHMLLIFHTHSRHQPVTDLTFGVSFIAVVLTKPCEYKSLGTTGFSRNTHLHRTKIKCWQVAHCLNGRW